MREISKIYILRQKYKKSLILFLLTKKNLSIQYINLFVHMLLSNINVIKNNNRRKDHQIQILKTSQMK